MRSSDPHGSSLHKLAGAHAAPVVVEALRPAAPREPSNSKASSQHETTSSTPNVHISSEVVSVTSTVRLSKRKPSQDSKQCSSVSSPVKRVKCTFLRHSCVFIMLTFCLGSSSSSEHTGPVLVSGAQSSTPVESSFKSPDPQRNFYEPYVQRRSQLSRIEDRLFDDTTKERSTYDFSFATQEDKYIALVRERNRLSAQLYCIKSLRAHVDQQLNRMKRFGDDYTGPAYGDDASLSPDSDREVDGGLSM